VAKAKRHGGMPWRFKENRQVMVSAEDTKDKTALRVVVFITMKDVAPEDMAKDWQPFDVQQDLQRLIKRHCEYIIDDVQVVDAEYQATIDDFFPMPPLQPSLDDAR
jgi:hypothetical protein